ncbi:hypothetical protein D3C83_61860 [compost metagenome]
MPRRPKRGSGDRSASWTPPDRLKLRRFSTKIPGMPASDSAGDTLRLKPWMSSPCTTITAVGTAACSSLDRVTVIVSVSGATRMVRSTV